MKARDPSFDLLKALAIFMVVLWHAISRCADRTQYVYTVNFIMGVNMPLFFMVSGYFAYDMVVRGDKIKFVNRLISYWWPVAVFSIVAALWACFVSGKVSISGIPLKAVKMFLFGAWFFYSLSICEILLFITSKMGLRKWLCCCVAVAFLFALPPFWYKGPSLNVFPFFLFGVFLLPKVLQLPQKFFFVIVVLCASFYLLIVFLGGDFWERGLTLYSNYLDVYHFKNNLLVQFVCRILIGICGSVALIGAVRGLLVALPVLASFAPIGEQTMGIYFVHGYGLAVLSHCELFTGSLLGLIVLSIIVFLSCGAIVALSKMSKITLIVFWGRRLKCP